MIIQYYATGAEAHTFIAAITVPRAH